MTNFRTQIPIEKYNFPIDYKSEVFSIGSCFAENISKKLDYFKLKNKANPFGVLFHPLAIEKVLEKALQQVPFTENDIFFHNELWHSFDVHSEFSSTDKNELLEQLNQTLSETRIVLEKSTHIIVTLGTSWVYRYSQTGKIVANCHKVPQKEFSKELLSSEQITKSLERIISLFQDKKIIFTISPVRHIKDGFFENNVSKSNLFVALQEVLSENVNYFPSYEIVMDELRDYRFFSEDMLHPNPIAIDYIWERFSKHYLSENALQISKEIDFVQKALNHKPFNPNTEAHKKFVESTQKRIERLGEIWKNV
ncbi:MAG TPA: GSCFA domain-containing protein [Brumimicrobium sp.]|nr:GSCFA domain-containing protein [Brumimicrobium sp.]